MVERASKHNTHFYHHFFVSLQHTRPYYRVSPQLTFDTSSPVRARDRGVAPEQATLQVELVRTTGDEMLGLPRVRRCDDACASVLRAAGGANTPPSPKYHNVPHKSVSQDSERGEAAVNPDTHRIFKAVANTVVLLHAISTICLGGDEHVQRHIILLVSVLVVDTASMVASKTGSTDMWLHHAATMAFALPSVYLNTAELVVVGSLNEIMAVLIGVDIAVKRHRPSSRYLVWWTFVVITLIVRFPVWMWCIYQGSISEVHPVTAYTYSSLCIAMMILDVYWAKFSADKATRLSPAKRSI